MRTLLRTLSITWALYAAAIRGEMQYRLNFLLLVLLGVFYQGSGFAFIWIVLYQFDTIAGWTFGEIALLYSLRLLAHAVWVVPFHQVQFLDTTVREGRFDRYLVRPLNLLLQVMTTRFQMNVIGDVAAAALLFTIAAHLVDLNLSPLTGAYLVLVVLGGALIQGAAVVAVSSLSFRFVQTWAANHLIDNFFLLFGSYPTTIFGGVLNWALTWVVPIAFIAYIPASVLLEKTGELHMSAIVAFGTPVMGAVWFLLAYWVWHRQARRYHSVGN